MFLGNIPEEDITNSYKYSTIIKVDQNSSKWASQLESIKFDNYSYSVNKNIVFEIKLKKIYISYKFYSYLCDTIFKPLIKTNICHRASTIFGETFSCSCESIPKFPDISFIVNGHIIKFTQEDLFEKTEFNCYFAMYFKKYNFKGDWIFGIPLFSSYFTYFDYDNHSIVLYSKFPFEINNPQAFKGYQKIQKVIVLFIIIECVFCLLFNAILRIKQKHDFNL